MPFIATANCLIGDLLGNFPKKFFTIEESAENFVKVPSFRSGNWESSDGGKS